MWWMIQSERLDNLPDLSADCEGAPLVFRKKIWFYLLVTVSNLDQEISRPLQMVCDCWFEEMRALKASSIPYHTKNISYSNLLIQCYFSCCYVDTLTLPLYKSKSDLIKCFIQLLSHNYTFSCHGCIWEVSFGRCDNREHRSMKENFCNSNTMVCIVYHTSPTRTDPCKLWWRQKSTLNYS